jgi:hypothetical protein
VEGSLIDDAGTELPSVVGHGGLLFGHAVRTAVVAGPSTGARLLSLSRPHFFTTLYQCPGLLGGLLKLGTVEDRTEIERGETG